jgi:ABC-2 type transport system permease protein
MTTTWSQSLSDAARFEVTLHRRNRLALALVVAFIPAWLTLVRLIIPDEAIGFPLAVTGHMVTVDGNRLAMISGAMNAVTLIVGFMMFSAVRRSSDFDRRLVLAGYSRSALLLAKLLGLLLATVLISLYASLVLLLFWAPEHFVAFFLSLVLSGLTYGGIGIVLGVVLRTELAGMFLIIMISLVDVMVQNPIITSATRTGATRLLPTYGSMQNAVGAAFTGDLSSGYYMLGLLWMGAAAMVGLVAFHHRTRDHIDRDESAATRQPQQQQPQERVATVHVSTQTDGSLVVRSFSGPVLICSCCEDPAEAALVSRVRVAQNQPARRPARSRATRAK